MEAPNSRPSISPAQHNQVLEQVAANYNKSIYPADVKISMAFDGPLKNVFVMDEPAQERTASGYFNSWKERFISGDEAQLVKSQKDVAALINDHKAILATHGEKSLILLTPEEIEYSFKNQALINTIIEKAKIAFRDKELIPAPATNAIVANFPKKIREEVDYIRSQWNVQLTDIEKPLKEKKVPANYQYGTRIKALLKLTDELNKYDVTALKSDNVFNQLTRMSSRLRKAEAAETQAEINAEVQAIVASLD
jgi:hypothetical protein